MTKPKVSVIIPVYKAEPYIEECVRTLFAQTLKDIEYIFVDDCSPDRSIEVMERVLQEFPERQPHVKVIRHEKNQGVAITRQHGTDAATGEYLIHCDPDDWVDLNMYEVMYKEAKATDADMVGCDFIEEYKDRQVIVRQNLDEPPEDIVTKIFMGVTHSCLWGRLIRLRFLKDNNARFLPELCLSEDLHYVVPLHLVLKKLTYIPEPFYHYRQADSSITHSPSIKNIDSAITALNALRQYANVSPKVFVAWQRAFSHAHHRLITHPRFYDPARWRKDVANLPRPYFGKLKNRISPWLVKHHFDTLNYLIIKIYRRNQE